MPPARDGKRTRQIWALRSRATTSTLRHAEFRSSPTPIVIVRGATWWRVSGRASSVAAIVWLDARSRTTAARVGCWRAPDGFQGPGGLTSLTSDTDRSDADARNGCEAVRAKHLADGRRVFFRASSAYGAGCRAWRRVWRPIQSQKSARSASRRWLTATIRTCATVWIRPDRQKLHACRSGAPPRASDRQCEISGALRRR